MTLGGQTMLIRAKPFSWWGASLHFSEEMSDGEVPPAGHQSAFWCGLNNVVPATQFVLTVWLRVLTPAQTAHLHVTAFPADADLLRISEVLAAEAGQPSSCRVITTGASRRASRRSAMPQPLHLCRAWSAVGVRRRAVLAKVPVQDSRLPPAAHLTQCFALLSYPDSTFCLAEHQ